jgi:hypothetical protein
MAVPELSYSYIENRPDLQVINGSLSVYEPEILHVDDYDLSRTKTKNGISTQNLHAKLSNNSVYNTRLYKPEDPIVDYERIVATSPAWHTDENDFFNTDFCNRLSTAGNTVAMFGHEQVLHRSLKDTKERFLEASVHNDAQAQHAILDVIGEEKIVQNSTEEIIASGMSKGSIVGRLAVFYANIYNRNIPYLDGVDPSGEHRWTKKDFNRHKFIQMGRGPILETVALFGLATEASPIKLIKTAVHYVTSPQLIPSHLAYTRSLVRSDAGKDKGMLAPEEGIMHLTCAEDCWFNQNEAWVSRYEDNDNTHVLLVPGGHLSCAKQEVRDATIDRIIKVQDLLEAGYRPQQIDPATQTLRDPNLKIAA